MPSLWICGDSNSGGVYNALTKPRNGGLSIMDTYKPAWDVVNHAVGAETSLSGLIRVRAALAYIPPTVALLCWGGADALHEFGYAAPSVTALLGFGPATQPEMCRASAAGRMIELARHVRAAGGTPIIVRGVGTCRVYPFPGKEAWWDALDPDVQDGWRTFGEWFSTAYKQIIDAVTSEDIRVLTSAAGTRLGYHTDEFDAALWSDGLHLSHVGYDDVACRVLQYMDREGLW